jgi:HEAT repeat protein
MAAWALGRSENPDAIPYLRRGLQSRYRSVQAHAARSLAMLGDAESAPLFLERLQKEGDAGLRMAYASAMGRLGIVEACDLLLEMLEESQDSSHRQELSLALARLVGEDRAFIQILKGVGDTTGIAPSQAVMHIQKKITHLESGDEKESIEEIIQTSAEAFARGDLREGTAVFSRVIRSIPAGVVSEAGFSTLAECARMLEEQGEERLEYLALALHILGGIGKTTGGS